MKHVELTDPCKADPTLPIVIEDDDPPEEQAQGWLAEAAALGLACSKEIFGEAFDEHMGMVLVVRFAAATVWRTSSKAPCWSKLDVATLKKDLAGFGLSRERIREELAALASFYAFLIKRKFLTSEQGEPLLRELFPYLAEHYRRTLPSSSGGSVIRSRAARRHRARSGRRRRRGRDRKPSKTSSGPTSPATKVVALERLH